MLGMAWGVLEWVVGYVWVLCLSIFIGVVVWTIIEKAGKLASVGAPGWNKLFRKIKG